MRICFFTENYYKGGLDTFLINLFNAWPDPKDEIIVVCNGTHPGLATIASKIRRPISIQKYDYLFTSRLTKGRSAVKWCRSFPVRAFFALCFSFLQYPILLPWYLLSFTWFFRRNDFDRLMVVNGGYPGSLICRCAAIAWKLAGRRPLALFSFHNLVMTAPWYFRVFENLIDGAVVHASAHILSVSEACLKTLSNRKAFLNCAKLGFVHNGIGDPLLTRDGEERKREDRKANDRYCLMLATYEARKGHGYLLQAFRSVIREFPDVCLRIYGYGKPHEKERVVGQVKALSLDDHVSVHDFACESEALIAGASVLVVPSQEYESFGLTIIEAMALGTPVVATNVGGMPEILADSNAGYVCSKDDPDAFAEALKRILGDQTLACELGRNGRQCFEQRFTASQMARKYEAVIKGSPD